MSTIVLEAFDALGKYFLRMHFLVVAVHDNSDRMLCCLWRAAVERKVQEALYQLSTVFAVHRYVCREFLCKCSAGLEIINRTRRVGPRCRGCFTFKSLTEILHVS